MSYYLRKSFHLKRKLRLYICRQPPPTNRRIIAKNLIVEIESQISLKLFNHRNSSILGNDKIDKAL